MSDTATEPRSELGQHKFDVALIVNTRQAIDLIVAENELLQPIWAVVTSRDDVKMSNLTYAEAMKFAEQGVRENHRGVTITTAEAAARSKIPTW